MMLQNTSINLSLERVLKYLKVDTGKKHFVEFVKTALDISYNLFDPKVIFSHSTIKKGTNPHLFINNIEFNNKVLYHNTSDTDECFPYIITLGKDIELSSFTDYMLYYYTDRIGNLFLNYLRNKLEDYLKAEFNILNLSKMNPGSINLWPLEENEKIFALFKDEIKEIGVSLTESYIIKPLKSISGIFFYKEESYYNCWLCKHRDCLSRKASFNQKMYNYYYSL